MKDPTLSDCINYMKQQLKGMEKYPKSYGFNISYYRKTIDLLETRGTTNGNCATCVKAVVIDERPHGEWIYHREWELDGECPFECSNCNMGVDLDFNFCPNCGSDNRREGDAE